MPAVDIKLVGRNLAEAGLRLHGEIAKRGIDHSAVETVAVGEFGDNVLGTSKG